VWAFLGAWRLCSLVTSEELALALAGDRVGVASFVGELLGAGLVDFGADAGALPWGAAVWREAAAPGAPVGIFLVDGVLREVFHGHLSFGIWRVPSRRSPGVR